MRLLSCADSNDILLTENITDNDSIPPYAILSHTWQKAEEVTFEELNDGTGKEKLGYKKIQFCAGQAKSDGLKYFWVDTCCINKSDRLELENAINSMFHWYRDATQCYVYLSDVTTRNMKENNELGDIAWEPAFLASRWFTRGWTLQELLAPRSVKFYSTEGDYLGDKHTLERQISETTSIPTTAILGADLLQFSIEERLSWAKQRHTTRQEDKVYSLIGIFDTVITLCYGEGEENAFRRLQKAIRSRKGAQECVNHLGVTDPRNDKKRIEETKGGLEDSYHWILYNTSFQQWRNEKQGRLLWIKGDPGKGKTMLLCGIIDELKKTLMETDLLSYFFCQATDARINSATAVLRGLLYLLVTQQPLLISHIRKRHNDVGRALFEDANAWMALCEIFANVLHDPNFGSAFLIIDAVDECMMDREKLLNFIARQSSGSSRIKWVVSSRNWPGIEEGLAKASWETGLSLELNAECVYAAVNVFIQRKVHQLSREKSYDTKTAEAVRHHLTSNADSNFLWAEMVCQNLKCIAKRDTAESLRTIPTNLNSLYERMVQQLKSSDNADLCTEILAVAATVYRPVSLQELLALLDQPDEKLASIKKVVAQCGSFLTLWESTIYFAHQSAKDFLLQKAFSDVFPLGQKQIHYSIFSRSLRVMFDTLRRDIYSLRIPGYLGEQVEQPEPDPLESSRYSCIYWIEHLCDSNHTFYKGVSNNLEIETMVEKFLKKKYLYWLEALSLCKSMTKGVAAVARLKALLKDRLNDSPLHRLLEDAYRFTMFHKRAIEEAPLQTYMSALVFSPADCLIRNLFAHESPDYISIIPPISGSWGACLRTLESHIGSVKCVAFSRNSTWLASASWDRTVKVWDPNSGACLQTLIGHDKCVTSVVFSCDAFRLASASLDNTIKVWCIDHSTCLQTLKGHSDWVTSVTFSHNSARIASGSIDNTVKIWNPVSGECLQTLNGHGYGVRSVSYSFDSARLASGSLDNTVKIWNTVSGTCLLTLKGHKNIVNSVAFSPNSIQLASGSDDGLVKIWDTMSGECLHTFNCHSYGVKSVSFSFDSARLASGSLDSTVKIWKIASGECLQTLEGHSRTINSVTFSHDSAMLASASGDGSIKVWNADSSSDKQTIDGHNDSVQSLAFSHDSTRLVSGSDDRTVKIWDAGSGACLQTLMGHSDSVKSVVFSHDSTKLASGSWDRTVRIWDVDNGRCLKALKGHSDWVMSAIFSPDSSRLASTSFDSTVRIWNVSTGACLQTLEGHGRQVNSAGFSHDSARLVSTSLDSITKIWDISSGLCLQTLDIRGSNCDSTFNAAGSCLVTKYGTFNNYSLATSDVTADSRTYQYQHLGLSSTGTWVTWCLKDIVYLPPEYFPSCSTIFGNTIGVGVKCGRVWMLSVR